MAAEIKDIYGIDAQLIAGTGGVFDVKADEALLFSKHTAGRFPENREVLDKLDPLVKSK